jgi:hypothetical protein
MPRFWLPLRGNPDDDLLVDLREPHLQRAIGVVYRPETERWSHYFHARLPDQFDALIHIDETTAVEPLEHTAGWHDGEAPETYPSTSDTHRVRNRPPYAAPGLLEPGATASRAG